MPVQGSNDWRIIMITRIKHQHPLMKFYIKTLIQHYQTYKKAFNAQPHTSNKAMQNVLNNLVAMSGMSPLSMLDNEITNAIHEIDMYEDKWWRTMVPKYYESTWTHIGYILQIKTMPTLFREILNSKVNIDDLKKYHGQNITPKIDEYLHYAEIEETQLMEAIRTKN